MTTNTPVPADAEYLIRKGAHWYRPNAQGYTGNIEQAGRYTLAEAIRHSHPNGPEGPRDEISYELAPPSAPADLVEAVENAVMRSQGLDPTEVCGLEIEDGDNCDSGTCCAAHFEDHDPAHARAVYRKIAQTAIVAYQAHMASDGVVQVDREAALALRLHTFSIKTDDYRAVDLREKIMNGAWDDKPSVQIFAAHRRDAAGSFDRDARCPICNMTEGCSHTVAERQRAAAGGVGDEPQVTCGKCQGNGEIVTDWDRYMHAHDGDKGDEAVAECPDCNGEGTTPQPDPRDAQVAELTRSALHDADDISERIHKGGYRGNISDTETLRNHVRKLCAALANSEGK